MEDSLKWLEGHLYRSSFHKMPSSANFPHSSALKTNKKSNYGNNILFVDLLQVPQ